MNGFRLLEHTADIGVAATGEDLAALFQQAAFGVRQVLSSAAVSPREERRVAVSAGDTEELLVGWLSELLYLFESELFLPAEIEIESVAASHLCARIRGEVIDPERFAIDREIKAITYHQLKVEESAEGWRAQVFVDL